MARSTGIVLTAVAIGEVNYFMQTSKPDFVMAMGGLGAALLIAGIEKIDETAGVGLAVILLIGVLLAKQGPLQRAPAEELASLLAANQK
jgi:hypothetical protein